MSEKINIDKIDTIQMRQMMIVKCPSFMEQTRLRYIDFGSLFLNNKGGVALSKTLSIANDTIDIINNGEWLFHKETWLAVHEALQVIVADAVQRTLSYAAYLFKKYLSVEYGVSVVEQYLSESAAVMKYYLKTPDELMKEISAENPDILEELTYSESEKEILETIENNKKKINDFIDELNEFLDTIEPYISEIAKYMVYGPDYAIEQLTALYNEYFTKGLYILNSFIKDMEIEFRDLISELAGKTGKAVANKINDTAKRELKKAIDSQNGMLVKKKVEALSLINKSTMKLLGLLGI